MIGKTSIANIANQVRSGKVTATSLVEEFLQSSKDAADYNVILLTRGKEALEDAKTLDERVADGEDPGVLAGIPFLVKDNFLTKGDIATGGSNILKEFEAPYTASAVQKLLDEGAILVGKANMDSFGHGSSTENSDFGVTKNAHDTSKVAGGSSGGSAVAVALGLVPFALGTDTGGSIRQPASFNGVVGYRPTYGLVSRYGVMSMISSTDVIGPITRTVEDAALVLDVIAGRDPRDSTTIERRSEGYSDLASSIKGKKFGLLSEYMGDGVSKEVAEKIQNAIKAVKAAGGEIKQVSIPELSAALAAYYIVMPAEVSSNMSRYDGMRFGYRSKSAKNLEETYTYSRSEGLNDETKRRIMIGTYVLSSGYYDAYYKKAQSVRTLLVNKFEEALGDVDVLIGPVAPTPAFGIGENTDDPLQMYLNDIMTVAPSLVGVPSISMPIGKIGKLPVGLQVMSSQANDHELLSIASGIEEVVGYES